MKRKAIGFFFSVLAWSAVAVAGTPVVKTHYGAVSGVATADSAVVSFKGISFATPPLGKLRWRAPKPVAPWKETMKADHFGASCIQGPNNELLPWTK